MPLLAAIYGVVVYALSLAVFVWAVGFLGNVPGMPTTIDTGITSNLSTTLAVDAALLTLFAVQHSVMARRSFKRWWTRFVPTSVERSTYILATTLVLALLLWQWRPIADPVVWDVTAPLARELLLAVFWCGWVVLLAATFLINHFEMFGLQQVYDRWRGREQQAAQFGTPGLYRLVRHPIYLGFVLSFWAAPRMSAGHLMFAIATTAYIFVGIWFEERDLVAMFGARYERYRDQVGMLFPRLRRSRAHERAES